MNLIERLKITLSENEKFCIGNKVLKNNLIEAALKLDKNLLILLIKDKELKDHFFTSVDGILVFDKIKFQKFVSNRQFLPNSYTSFKNKIGLTTNGEYMAESREVVLDFPFKDCILKGGQKKHDEKRNEVFLNETLAMDEIDKLFEPKILTNFKRIDGNGASKVNSISLNDNFIIKGNNLIALHSLKRVYNKKVKLIYIDPPYNTGNDSFNYNDNFNHSTWLTFMKNRLTIAWKLLREDGSIFIQVDDNEFAYLKVLCDELFGRENFKEAIVFKSSTESGVNAINVKRGERLFKVKEYILFYSKSTTFRFNPFYTRTDFSLNYKYEVIKSKGNYSITNLSQKFQKGFKGLKITQAEINLLTKNKFIKYALNNPENIYSLEKNIKKASEKFKTFVQKHKTSEDIHEFTNSKSEIKLIYKGGVLVPLKERIVSDERNKYFGVLASDLWVDIGTTSSKEGGIDFSNGKKPEKLLKRIIEMATEENDIVLDYHLGSGTTAAVAHKMNRKYIGLEQLDYGINDSTVRLKNVIDGEQSGVSKITNWKGGGSFVYVELMKKNELLVQKISKTFQRKELVKIYNKIDCLAIIDFRVGLDMKIKSKEHFKKLSINEQKAILINLLDKNELYVNLSDIDDKDFKVPEHEKLINNKFYGC